MYLKNTIQIQIFYGFHNTDSLTPDCSSPFKDPNPHHDKKIETWYCGPKESISRSQTQILINTSYPF